jgi:hypothetical protein
MKKLLAVVLSISFLAVSPAYSATIAAGQKCAKLNQKATSGAKSFICAKRGGKLAWKILPATPPKPTPTPEPSASPAPTPSLTPVVAPAVWKEYSSSEVIARAKDAIDRYLAVKRSPNQVITVIAQDGVNQTLKNWIIQGATLVAQSFAYPASTRPFIDVVAMDRDWLREAYLKAGFSEAEVKDRLGGFDAGAPAFGGTTTNTWNAKSIANENLMVRNKVGMAQTAGHEFFHSIQERLAQRNPGKYGSEIPNWFWEGPAMFVGIHSAATIGAVDFATEGRQEMLNRFKNGRAEMKVFPLKDVKANDAITDPYAIGYAGSEYLIAQIGVEKFLNIYVELGKGKSFADAFKDATGFALDEFYIRFEMDRAALGFPRS